MKRVLLVLLACMAAGCGSTVIEPDRVDDAHFVAPDGSYRLTLPLGWRRDGNTLTLDGTQSIAFNAGPVLASADPRSVDPSAPQLIAAMEDELGSQPGVRVLECRAVTLGGLPGFRMHFLRSNPAKPDDPQREQVICGAVSGATLFAFFYEAAPGEAFASQSAVFDAMVASFEPLAAPTGR